VEARGGRTWSYRCGACAHGHQRGHGVLEDALPGGCHCGHGGRPRRPQTRRRGLCCLEYGLHGGLALADEPGDELRGEEGLPEHLLDEGQP